MGCKLLLAIGLLLSGCASPQWRTVMVYKDGATGHYVDGSCRLWAQDMQRQVGFPTKRISWTVIGIDPFSRPVRHEVLAYSVGREVWFVDNFSRAPRWVGVEGERLEVLIQMFYAPAFVVIGDIVVDGG